jgi:hypothetical protein
MGRSAAEAAAPGRWPFPPPPVICRRMNRHDPRAIQPAEAQLRYEANKYTVLRHGAFVRCAVTGRSIPLDELRYWSVERQEAYSSREAVLQRLREDGRYTRSA